MWQIGMTVVVRSYSTVLGLGTVADVRDGCPVLTADRPREAPATYAADGKCNARGIAYRVAPATDEDIQVWAERAERWRILPKLIEAKWTFLELAELRQLEALADKAAAENSRRQSERRGKR